MAGDELELLDATCDSDGVLRASVICSCSLCANMKQHSNTSGQQAAHGSQSGVQHVVVPETDIHTKHGILNPLHNHVPAAWRGQEGEQMVLAVLHTGAYQDALASHHNLYGQLETWYVMEKNSPAVDANVNNQEFKLVHDDSGECCSVAAAACEGLELPAGWRKGRSIRLLETITLSKEHNYIAAVRDGESVSDMLHAVGMDMPDKRSLLGSRHTYTLQETCNSSTVNITRSILDTL